MLPSPCALAAARLAAAVALGSRPMPQLTLFGKPAANLAAPAAKKAPAPSAARTAPKGKASASRTGRNVTAPASSSSDVGAKGAAAELDTAAQAAAELDSAAQAQAVWAAHRSSQVTGISARPPPLLPPQVQPLQTTADSNDSGLLGATAPCAGGSTTLERMQAQERQLLEQHVASRARLVEPKKKAYTAEAGWRRTADGERVFLTASGKRLTGKVAHAAAKRMKS